MSFLSDQKNWRAPRPPPTLIILPKSTDQNSELAILFSIVKNLITMSLGTTYSPQSPWEGQQVTIFDKCLHIVMVIGKCTGVFRRIFLVGGGVEKGGVCWGTFPSIICHGGRKFS